MLTKNKVQKHIEGLPEEFSLEELIDRFILLDKVERGLSESNSGDVTSNDELTNELESWLK